MKKMIVVFCVLSILMFYANAMAQQSNVGIGAGSNANAEATAQAGSAVNGDIGSNNISIDNRPFAVPGNAQYGPVINYFTKPLPSEGFQPVEQVIMYSCWFTEGALEEMAAIGMFGKTEADVRIVNPKAMAKPAPEDGKTRWIKIVVQTAPMKDVIFKGFVTARATSMDATMVNVMANAALDALRKGANVIHFTAQGAVRDVFSKGWGIGFGSTFAQIHDSGKDQDRSSVAYGGMGYSSAKAGTRDLPWLQGFALVDEKPDYPKLESVNQPKAAVDTDSQQTGNHRPAKKS